MADRGGPAGGGARWLQREAAAKDRRGTLARLGDRLRGTGSRLSLALGLVALDSLVVLSVPWLIGRAVDALATPSPAASGAGGVAALGMAVAALVLAYLVDALLTAVQGRIMARASQGIVATLRRDLFRKLQVLPVATLDRWSHGDLMSRLANDVDNVSTSLAQSLTQLLSTLVGLAGSLAFMLALSPLLTLAALATLPLVFLLTRTVSRRTRVLFRDQQVALGALNGHVEEHMAGLAVVKAYGREAEALAEFEARSEALRAVGTRAQTWSGYIMPLMNVINNFGFAMVALAGGSLAVHGLATVGLLASFISYARQFTRPLNDLANTWNSLQTALAGAERVFEILDLPEEDPGRGVIPDGASPAAPLPLRGEVAFQEVSFAYESGRPVLEGLSFEAPAGSLTALVGPTGSGKTTIVNLLARFHEVGSGRILVDGEDLRDIPRARLRRSLGVVLQDSYLFSGTIRDNLGYGREGATEEEIRKAARAANAEAFILRLPAGYDTVLGPGGSPLSEGQRQLLTLARAVLTDPAILILDEATSSVDTRTELHIQEALAGLLEGRTSLVVAHRLSTIRAADQILVIDGGRIVERGRHADLLGAGGLYATMWARQARSIAT